MKEMLDLETAIEEFKRNPNPHSARTCRFAARELWMEIAADVAGNMTRHLDEAEALFRELKELLIDQKGYEHDLSFPTKYLGYIEIYRRAGSQALFSVIRENLNATVPR